MRKLFTQLFSAGLIALGALSLAPEHVKAQATPIWANQSLITGASIVASSATNYNAVIDCRKQAKINVQFNSTNTVTGGGGGSGSYIAVYSRSSDGVNYSTTLESASCPTPNGTNAFTWSTNLDTAGCGFLKINYITNAMASNTNIGTLSVTYGVKIGAP